MSSTRESFLTILVVSAVISALMVGGALAFFLPEKKPAAPPAGESAEEFATLRREMDRLRDALTEASEARKALQVEIEGFRSRVEELERAPRALPPAEEASGKEGAEPTTEEKMMAGMRAMMKVGMARAKDRFIDEILNPTEASEARAKRQRDRIVERIAEMLDLDERDTAEMDRILTEVDTERRARLRTLFQGKSDPRTEVKYSEVKRILDDSFKAEDEMVRQSLSAEKAKSFQENAAPFRQFIYGAAQMAFPEKKTGE